LSKIFLTQIAGGSRQFQGAVSGCGTRATIVRAQKRFGSMEAAQLDKLFSRSTELRRRHNANK
jgi:hypothetical protein